MVGLIRIGEWPFLFEKKGYWVHGKYDSRVVFVEVSTYNRNHDECLSRLTEW